jgi:uncharacterized membrane protein
MFLDALTVARAVHVLAIVHWIGGVSVVTTIVLPHARRLADATTAVEAFEAFERRFAKQARMSILITGLSGIYMLFALNAWYRFTQLSFWWLHLMVAVWALFAVMVYVLEPLFVHKRFRTMALENPDGAFTLATRVHVVALVGSAITIGVGLLGAHGALP